MNELDTKQKVLISIYTEYQKDLPDMSQNINPEILGIDIATMNVALEKLDNEGYITGVKFARGGRGNRIIGVIKDNMMMTRLGITYVEEKLDISPTLTAGEKVSEVSKKVTSWGYAELKDFAAKVTGEIVKGTVGL